MNRYLLKVLISLLLFGWVGYANAKGPVWQVSDGTNRLLLGGTIHLLSKRDYPLPPEFDAGYQLADLLVFEIDPDIVHSPIAQQLFVKHSLYTDGRTLKNVLSPKTYAALNDYLNSRGLLITPFLSTKPGMLSMILTVIELQQLGLAGTGVDEFFSNRAKRDAKQRLHLETLEQQLTAMVAIGDGKEDEVIMQTLDEIGRLSEVMHKTKKAWRKGDNKALIKVALKPWMDSFPELYQLLLVERNRRWLPQLEAYMTTPEVEFVLVGALHLAGPDGVLALLKAKGYKVEQFSP